MTEENVSEQYGVLIGENLFCRIREVVLKCDITDASGNIIANGNYRQSTNSIVKFTEGEIPASTFDAEKIREQVFK